MPEKKIEKEHAEEKVRAIGQMIRRYL